MLTGTPLMVLKRRVAIRVLLCALGAPVVLGLLAAAVVATLEEKPEPGQWPGPRGAIRLPRPRSRPSRHFPTDPP